MLDLPGLAPAPINDADNRPARPWHKPSLSGEYEIWYAVVWHPEQKLALWFRYTLLARHDGTREGRLWGMWTQPGGTLEQVAATRCCSLEDVHFAQHRFGVALCDRGLFANGLARGRLPTEHGELSWDLRFTPSQRTFATTRSAALSWLVARSRHLLPNPRVRASGIVQLGSQRFEFDGAAMTQGHTYGRRMGHRWAWCACPFFDDDSDSGFEGLVYAGARGPVMMTFELLVDGQRHTFNRLRDLRGAGLGLLGAATQARWSLGEWSFTAASEALSIEGRIWADTPFHHVRYQDVDGSFLFNCHQSLSNIELNLRFRDGRQRHLRCHGRAASEYVDRQPPEGAPADYLPVFA